MVARATGCNVAGGGRQARLTDPAKGRLGQDQTLAEGRREAIQPKMRGEAEIKTSERWVIKVLLSPVMQAGVEAGRER